MIRSPKNSPVIVMAGEFRQLRWSIWLDPDWQTLTAAQQHLYLLLLSHPKLNPAGVIETPLDRIVNWVADFNIITVRKLIAELIERRYILQDEVTVETLVRSFVRYDGMLKVPNQAMAVAKAWLLIESPDLQTAVLGELRRVYQADRQLSGWRGIRDVSADLMDKITNGQDGATVHELPKGSRKASRKPSPKGSGNP